MLFSVSTGASSPRGRVARGLTYALTVLAAAFFLLAFVHLRADFPNGSPWNDWSKTTDEGWYAGGAVHHTLTGEWLQPGAFNPAVAMPVWPVIAAAWFRAAGFGMVQLRVLTLLLTGLSLLMLFRLVRQGAGKLAASFAVALMAANPFVYSFSRLAILEPVMIFFLLLALLLAGEGARRGGLMWFGGAGLALAALVLTKTTGLALVPGVLLFLWAGLRARGADKAAALRGVIAALAAALIAWLTYDRAVVRRHPQDYHLLFRINQDRVHLSIVPLVGWHTLRDGMWIGPLLYPLAIVALVAAVVWLRELWRQPLFGSAMLLAAGYLAFIGYHTNLQPRYYLPVTPALVIVVVLALHALLARAGHGPDLGLASETWDPAARNDDSNPGAPVPHLRSEMWGTLYAGAAGVLVICLAFMAVRTVRYALHPQYAYLAAADGIARAVAAEPGAHRLAIGNQGDTLSLWNGIPAICAEYSADAPLAVLQRYRPGWYVTILGAKPNAMTRQLQETYRLQQRASFEVFDDPERHTLVLYRLQPRESSKNLAGSDDHGDL